MSDYALEVREEVAFFQIIATMFRKYSPPGRRSPNWISRFVSWSQKLWSPRRTA